MDSKETITYKKKKLPLWLKAVLIKAWFAGAVFFFMGMGLFINSADQLDITLAIGLVLGIITDVMVNRIFVRMEHGKEEYHPYMMFPQKSVLNFFLNVVYGIILSFLIAYTYNLLNIILIGIKGLPETAIVMGAEPVTFGLIFLAYDIAPAANEKGDYKGRGKG